MQTVLYFRMFSTDYWTTKAEVCAYHSSKRKVLCSMSPPLGRYGVVGYFTAHIATLLNPSSFLDLIHTAMILVANYLYFVDSFGVENITDRAFWAVGVSFINAPLLRVFIEFLDLNSYDSEPHPLRRRNGKTS